jgi:alpha-galactosidase
VTIDWDPATREWHLHNGRTSWVLAVLENGWLGHLHAGAPLAPGRSYRHIALAFNGYDNRTGEPVGLALPGPGVGDYRVPALVVETADGATVLDPQVAGHRIVAGKPPIGGGLPATYVEADGEADTLEIDLVDAPSGIRVTLAYTLFAGWPVVARSMRVANEGGAPATVRCAMSASLDLPDAAWTLVQLSGAWSRERDVVERALVPGRQSVGTVRGGSSAEHNPFLALRRASTTEGQGEAWGAALVYSGNHLCEVDVDPFGTARLRLGIHPDTFSWRLEPGETFRTPEAVLAWSGDGLGGVSAALHEVFRTRLARGPWRDADRPVLLNNWEGTYFDFDHDRLVAMAASAKDLGVELFVLDDGWFGARNDDDRGLGDWTVNLQKLPKGLDGLAAEVHGLGLKFGLWIEPEMVNPDSDLFRAHPDWAIGVPGRKRTLWRNQLVLDLAQPAVVDHLATAIGDVLAGAQIDYVKWDWNRYLTEPWTPAVPADRQGELFHRYVLGLYELYSRLVARFPSILFESCASGGARFDAGLLAWAPQAWTSDDTDAVERLAIQWGTSIPYPLSSIGAHVSAVPNHQTGRITPIGFRAAVAMFGAFGYELDPTALSDEERAEVRRQVAFYRERRDLFQRGRFLRLRSPFEGRRNEAAWMVADEAGSRAVVGFYRVLHRPWPRRDRLVLRGLDPAATYELTAWMSFAGPEGTLVRGGDELMRLGLRIEPPEPPPTGDTRTPDGAWIVRGDFQFRLYDLRRV